METHTRYPGRTMAPSFSSSHDTERAPMETHTADVPEKRLSAPEPVSINERRLMWKIDLRLVPPLCVLYLLAFLDRVNIANAKLYNLSQDLGLVGNQYNIALVLFFVPYVAFEIPANLLLKKFRPSIWRIAPFWGGADGGLVPSIMFCFGLVMTLQGVVVNFAGLAATRFFLGLCEAGAFPGCFYLLSMWYKRTEAQKRFTFFFSSTTLAGAFGGLLASAIGKMDGIRGYSGWRWIFILEGIATCLLSIVGYFVIVDFPEEAKFLSEPEREFIIEKLRKDSGNSAYEYLSWRRVFSVFKDWKIWVGGFMYLGMIVGAYGYAYFSPTIISQLGYTAVRANLLSTPPWAVAFVFAMTIATISDYLAHRFLFAITCIIIAMIGFIVLLVPDMRNSVYYGALFLAAPGAYTAMPIIVCWFNTNLGGHLKRSVGSAWQVGFGNIGGIIAVYVFLPGTAPRYVLGKSVCIGFFGLAIISTVIYYFGCAWENRRRDKRVGRTDLSEEEMSRLGDSHPDFRYML